MPITAAISRINVCSTKTRDMNATVDALTDLEHRLTEALSDALSAAECARLEFEARLASALEAEIACKPASPSLCRPRARSNPSAARGGRGGERGEMSDQQDPVKQPQTWTEWRAQHGRWSYVLGFEWLSEWIIYW